VDPLVDHLLAGQKPIEDFLGGDQPLLPVDVGVRIDDPAARELQQAVLHLLDLLLKLVLLRVGAGDGADARADERLSAVAVPHGRLPAVRRIADVGLHKLGFQEGLAGAGPFLGVFLLPLLRVGVPGARIADRIDVGERFSLAAEVGQHATQRVQERVQPGVVEELLGVDLSVAELLVQPGHADEQRGISSWTLWGQVFSP